MSDPPGEVPPAWRRLDLGACEPYRAQTFAESVAVSVAQGEAPDTLLLVRPRESYVSLGFHQVAEEELDLEEVARRGLTVIRRVTGGGTTFLDPSQTFYQLVYREGAVPGVPGEGGARDLAHFLRGPLRCLHELGLRADLRPPSDLVVAGRKISGNAGGDWEGAHILVGGLLGSVDVEAMADILRSPHPRFRELLRSEMARELTSLDHELPAPPAGEVLPRCLARGFEEEELFRLVPGEPLPAEEARFQREVLPRHRERSWVQLPPLPPRAPREVIRAVKVAGDRFALAVRMPGEDGLYLAVSQSGALVHVEHVEGDRAGSSQVIPPGDPRRTELEGIVARWAGA